jgi:hypothetical protein
MLRRRPTPPRGWFRISPERAARIKQVGAAAARRSVHVNRTYKTNFKGRAGIGRGGIRSARYSALAEEPTHSHRIGLAVTSESLE